MNKIDTSIYKNASLFKLSSSLVLTYIYENFTNRILKCIDDRLSSQFLTDSELKDINLDELKYLIKRAAIFFEDFGKKY